MSFRGLHSINMDAKGRMAVPTRLRTIIDDHNSQGKLIVTIDSEAKSLVIYHLNDFIEIERQIEAAASSKSAKRLSRLIIGYATDIELDGSGRVLIPAELRELAGLKKKVVLVGQGKKLELWNEDAWNDKREVMLQELADEVELPDELQDLPL